MMALFTGMEEAHGTYELTGDPVAGQKFAGKAVTKREPVTLELWEDHVKGKNGIGIIPIDRDSMCRWGAIDIDVYDRNMREVVEKIGAEELPLVPCLSKSGGLHCFLFLSEPVPAALLQGKLKEIAASIGYGTAEIFPKQTQVLLDRGDLGNWLNMPYFGNSNRKAVVPGVEKPLEVEEFLDAAQARSLTYKELNSISVVKKKAKTAIEDGPPCLQACIQDGFGEGSRNNGLYNLGVYLKKAFPNDWTEKLEEYNRSYMSPPLGATEVLTIIKSLEKKTYRYKCNEAPIASYCNSAVCKNRRYGIDSSQAMPALGSLTKLDTDPPVWFIDVEGKRMELATEDIQKQHLFQKRCMEQLNFMPGTMKQDGWVQLLQNLFENLIVLAAPADAGVEGHFYELLDSFLTDRPQGKVRDDLLIGKAYTEDGKSYFRLRDLKAYLTKMRFNDYTSAQISLKINKIGGGDDFFNIKGRGTNVRYVPSPDEQTEPSELPAMGEGVF
jgi:hypothetical protein